MVQKLSEIRQMYDACPECGSENLGVSGNGAYRKFRCREAGCYWFHRVGE